MGVRLACRNIFAGNLTYLALLGTLWTDARGCGSLASLISWSFDANSNSVQKEASRTIYIDALIRMGVHFTEVLQSPAR